MITRLPLPAFVFVVWAAVLSAALGDDSAERISLSGRVVDTSGKPVPDLAIEIWEWPEVPEGVVGVPERVKFGRNFALHTDKDGRYQTPRELKRESVYQAKVNLKEREPAETLPFTASAENKTEFADLTVRRTTTLAGRVVDRQGGGVRGATVFQAGDLARRLQTATDAQGRFRLEGAMADPAFLFVTKPGFRFCGRLIEEDEEAATIILTRNEEPAEAWRTLPLELTKERRTALALRVLEPCLKKLDSDDEDHAAQTLLALARVDPVGLLARLEMHPPQNAFVAGVLKRAAVAALAAADLDEALAVAESIENPAFRSMGYLDVVDLLGADERPRKLELLSQATVAARQTAEPEMKVIQLAATAERWLDLGARDEAARLFRDGVKLAQELNLAGLGGYARGAFAEELSQIDLPAALELMKELPDRSEFDRHHGNLAHELAAKSPAEAERILGMLHGAAESDRVAPPRDLWGERVCYRMAPVDLPRARRIAEAMTDPYLKARAHGAMARAIAGQDPKIARELIENAFGLLQQVVDARETRDAAPANNARPASVDDYNGIFSAASVAGSLLPVAEAIDPTLVPEYFWRAVSFRLPRRPETAAERLNAALAMMLARYNHKVAAAELKLGRVYGGRRDPGLAALALIDPARAAAAIDEEFDPEGADQDGRLELAEVLVLEGDALWQKLRDMLGLWSIDVEDL